MVLVGRQPPQHLADGADPQPRLTRLRPPLVVLAVPTVPAPPREGPLRYPPLRQLHEPLRTLGPLYHRHPEPGPRSLQPGGQGMVAVLRVTPDDLQAGEAVPVQLPQQARCSRPDAAVTTTAINSPS